DVERHRECELRPGQYDRIPAFEHRHHLSRVSPAAIHFKNGAKVFEKLRPNQARILSRPMRRSYLHAARNRRASLSAGWIQSQPPDDLGLHSAGLVLAGQRRASDFLPRAKPDCDHVEAILATAALDLDGLDIVTADRLHLCRSFPRKPFNPDCAIVDDPACTHPIEGSERYEGYDRAERPDGGPEGGQCVVPERMDKRNAQHAGEQYDDNLASLHPFGVDRLAQSYPGIDGVERVLGRFRIGKPKQTRDSPRRFVTPGTARP